MFSRRSSNTTAVSDVVVTTVRRVCNTATLSSVAETGLVVARQAGAQPHVRRARKAPAAKAGNDDKRLQTTLKRLGTNNIPGIDEVSAIAACVR